MQKVLRVKNSNILYYKTLVILKYYLSYGVLFNFWCTLSSAYVTFCNKSKFNKWYQYYYTHGTKDINANKVIFLPSETAGNDIYDSISDMALRLLSSTFILSTNWEAHRHTFSMEQFTYVIAPSEMCLYQLTLTDLYMTFMMLLKSFQTLISYQDLARPVPPVIMSQT